MTKKAKTIIQHGLSIFLLLISVAVAVGYFGKEIFYRYGQSYEDLSRSFCYYFIFLFAGEENVITPTVQLFPAEMETLLPLSYEEFKALFELYFQLLVSKEIFQMWLEQTLQIIGDVAWYISLFALPAVTFVFVMVLVYQDKDNDYNKDSGALKAWKKFRDKYVTPCVKAVKGYISFLKKSPLYLMALALVWCYALNFLTIGLEALAFVFYVGPGLGLRNIWVQIAKLVIDFSVAWFFFPWPVWAAVGYWLLHLWRRHLGTKKLKEKIKAGFELMKKYPGALFFVGRQRSKKTSCVVMCKFLYERFYRDRALKKLLKWKKRFPRFPWINVERFLIKARKEHKIFMLYHCRKFARRLRLLYRVKARFYYREKLEAEFRKRYGYEHKDYMFGYELEEGRFEYDSNLDLIDVFKAIEIYMQLFFIYGQEGTLDFSNFAIREDFTFKDEGNFPIFDGDMLKKTTKESFAASQYSHVMVYDAFRPGVKFDENSPYKDAAEYGIRVAEEYAKERGNKDTRLKAPKDAEETYATQNNDGYELDNKVRGQIALVDFDDYSVGIYDDQREGSLGADNKDLATVCKIEGQAEEHLLLPLFEVEELLFEGLEKLYDKIYLFLHWKKGSNTLLQYMLDKLLCPLFLWRERLKNNYTTSKVTLRMKDGSSEETIALEELWILHRVVYRGAYASDSCKSFYEYRFEKSKKGMDDFPTYGDINVTMKEREAQGSYFSEAMLTKNGIKSARKPHSK